MNGVHDMGGMHGFGPVRPEADEPVFHAPWEGRVFAFARALGAWGKWNGDYGRHTLERLPPADYLRLGYYEKWLAGFMTRWTESGLVTQEELATGKPDPGSERLTPRLKPEAVLPGIMSARSTRRETAARPRFAVGGQVRARNINPTGHTRLPRYVRGRIGTIEALHGAHAFPDANALYQGENPQPLYTVRFAARELWGEAANPADAVYLDLWESYLDPA